MQIPFNAQQMKYLFISVILMHAIASICNGLHQNDVKPDSALTVSAIDELIKKGNSLYNTQASQSLSIAEEALKKANKINYEKGIVNAYKLLGISNWLLGNYQQAHLAYDDGLKLARQRNDSIDVSIFLVNFGVLYSDMGNFRASLESYLSALDILENTNKRKNIAICYQNIGEIYKSLREYQNAMKFNTKALQIFEEIEDLNGIAVIYNNNSDILIAQGKLNEAYKMLVNSRQIFKNVQNIRGVSITTNSIGQILTELERFEEAEKELQLSLNTKKSTGDKHGMVNTLQSLGTLKMKRRQNDSAQWYFEEALSMAKRVGLKEQEILIYQSLSNLNEQMGRYVQALELSRSYNQLKDSIFGIEKNKQIIFLQTLYDTEKKNKENELLRKNQIISEQLLKQQETKSELYALLLLFSIVIFSVLGYAVYQKNKSNHKLKILNQYLNDKSEEIEIQAESLKEANKVVQELNHNLESKVEERTQQLLDFSFKNSHEIRGPLSRILGLINLRKENKKSLPNDELLSKLEDSALELDNIVREINNILVNKDFKNKGTHL